MFTRKNMIIISLVVFCLSITTLNAQVSKQPIIATMSWEDGYQDIYLQAGTYFFVITANVTTHIPFDWTNTWGNRAEIVSVDNYFMYGSAHDPVVGVNFNDVSDFFSVEESGTYSIRSGAYAIWVCTVNSNEAKLKLGALYQNQ